MSLKLSMDSHNQTLGFALSEHFHANRKQKSLLGVLLVFRQSTVGALAQVDSHQLRQITGQFPPLFDY